MSYLVPGCPSTPVLNPDNTLSCADGWVMVDLPGPDPIHNLTQTDLDSLTSGILLAFSLAFLFRFTNRFLFQSGFGRNG